MRLSILCVVAVASVWPLPSSIASTAPGDVRVEQRRSLEFSGTDQLSAMVAGLVSETYGGPAGQVETVALSEGTRLVSSPNSRITEIADLGEQKVYTLDRQRKLFTAETFPQKQKALEEFRRGSPDIRRMAPVPPALGTFGADPIEASSGRPPTQNERIRKFEFDVDRKDIGGVRAVAGIETRGIALTLSAREKGKTLWDGGWVATIEMWHAPSMPALDALLERQRRYVKAVSGGVFAGSNARLSNDLATLMPEYETIASRLWVEADKMPGTLLAHTVRFELVRSEREIREAAADAARRPLSMPGGVRVVGGSVPKREKVLTSALEFITITLDVTGIDASVPAEFKLVKSLIGSR